VFLNKVFLLYVGKTIKKSQTLYEIFGKRYAFFKKDRQKTLKMGVKTAI